MTPMWLNFSMMASSWLTLKVINFLNYMIDKKNKNTNFMSSYLHFCLHTTLMLVFDLTHGTLIFELPHGQEISSITGHG